MSINVNDKDLGLVTAYAYAVSKGYEGTEEEFAELMASYAETAETAVEAALKSEGHAIGEQDGIPVSSDSPYYHNNAKYYSEQAEGSATTASDKASEASGSASSASGSADSASANALKSEGYAIGKQNGSDVGSGSPYYHANAKYYSEQASADATQTGLDRTQTGLDAASATASASSASTNALKAEGFAVGQQNGTDVDSESPYYENNAEYYAGQAADSATAAAQSAAEAAQTLEDKADVDGYYSEMTVGSAEQLLSKVGVTDSVPYLFRTSGGSNDIGDREVDKLVGGTIAWNQQINENVQFISTGGTVSTTDQIGTFIASATDQQVYKSTNVIEGHKYFASATAKATTANANIYLLAGGVNSTEKFDSTNWKTIAIVFNAQSTSGASIGVRDGRDSGWDAIYVKNYMIIDLTQAFSSTIADYLYALESGSSGSGIAKLKSWGFCTKDYYAYNAGDLQSVKTSEHRMVGFNQWDEQWESYDSSQIKCKNRIRVIPGETYYFKSSVSLAVYRYKDATSVTIGSKSVAKDTTWTIPNDTNYILFYSSIGYGTTYKGDICMNISGSKNGTYEPYSVRSYPLDNDLVLRGVLKLDASNNLRYDGDEYSPDGTVKRRYGVVDLGTLTWSYSTNGYFYALLNPLPKYYGTTIKSNAICSKYPVLAYDDMKTTDKTCSVFYAHQNGINLKDDSYNGDASALRTGLSGTYLVYELATPTTESADPYQETQICSPYGTEEYVDERTVPIPVGHSTFYPENLRKKIEDLPSNFSTLIAQTEAQMTATRNYSVNDFLIVGNQLYKVTANIGSGGAITVGSNVTATTLGAEITALLNTINS